MKMEGLTKNRKQIVKVLEHALNMSAKYLGPPSFAYEIGPYTIDRYGDVTVADDAVSEDVISLLLGKELVREDPGRRRNETLVTVPLSGHTGRSLKNLLCLINAKGVLISKAVGRPGNFSVSERLLNGLLEISPDTQEEFMRVISIVGEEGLRGISFANDRIVFSFPHTNDTDKIRSYMQLVKLLDKRAREAKRISPEPCKVTNEKYTFRHFLVRLGMTGDTYEMARWILLQNLNGHVAFRTKEQAEQAAKKLKKKREEERERAKEMAFHRL